MMLRSTNHSLNVPRKKGFGLGPENMFLEENPVLATLYTLHFTLPTPHFKLYTPHFTLFPPLYTSHFTFYTLHRTLYTPHLTLYTLHSTLHTLLFTLYIPHFTLHTLHLTLHTSHLLLHLHSTLYTPFLFSHNYDSGFVILGVGIRVRGLHLVLGIWKLKGLIANHALSAK